MVKAIEDAMAKAGADKAYKGGVYLKVQEQWLNGKGEKTQIADGEGKAAKKALKEVTVYAAPERAQNTVVEFLKAKVESEATDATAAQKKLVVALGEAAKFTAEAIDFGDDKHYPVVTELLKKFKLEGKSGPDSAVEDDDKAEMVYYQKVEAKPTG